MQRFRWQLPLIVAVLVLVWMADPGMLRAGELTDGSFQSLVERYCNDCHSGEAKEAGLDLEQLTTMPIAEHPFRWEKAVRKLESRQMPPVGENRPSDDDYAALTRYLVRRLDAAAAKQPQPGYVDTLRRLNRTEYQNAIRDLLAVEIDAAELLPADESSHGFDHITVGDLSPALLTRYVQAAQKIARLAVGSPLSRPDGKNYRIAADVTQEGHVAGLPLGTRGGGLFRHTFPQAGEYEIQVRLMRDRDDEVEGLRGKHQLEILLDGKRLAGFTVEPPKNGNLADFDDSQLRTRIPAPAGLHALGVTFIRQGASLEETKRQPLNVHFNLHRHPRLNPAIYEVSIVGPFASSESAVAAEYVAAQHVETASRQRIFIARPSAERDALAAARTILSALARRAYRRPVEEADLERLLTFFRNSPESAGFEAGVESALQAMLTSPHFLLKIERVPKNVAPGDVYPISDIELASRLSFFVWSSLPDDELLDLAERGELRRPEVLEQQVKRMLADPKAANLATNFAGQWLHLRNLSSITPDGRLYPDFDENLRQSMRRETELHLEELVRADRSVLDLLQTDHTFVDERLAQHYEIPHVTGSRFRRVELAADSPRGGLLRHGSILTVTSYATRTSPVIRGNWVLENILGAPAPPPPPDVPSLDSQKVISETLSIRARLAQHRAMATCASCHNLMDPVGFALENFDAVGRWRAHENGQPVDVEGSLPDGSRFAGVAGLEAAILARPELFVTALTEKLMTFALGRVTDAGDGPAVRAVVQQAAKQDYRLSAIVLGIARSTPFQMRTAR